MSQSEFLTFSRDVDQMTAEAADLAIPGITFLRLEFARVRPGMGSFLLKVSTPKSLTAKKSNTIVTLRCDKRQATPQGLVATARTIKAEMLKRGDMTADWATVDAEAMAKLLVSSLKFFAVNTNTTLMQSSTEALA